MLIANSTKIEENDEIIEIGPGTGNLTEFLLKKNPKKMYDKAGLNSSQISKKIADILFQKETIRVVKN